jgi:hypothetical protein
VDSVSDSELEVVPREDDELLESDESSLELELELEVLSNEDDMEEGPLPSTE